jgi:ADP-heptose:LPS heptosyltransferase
MRIGLAWSGKSRFTPDQDRAMPLAELAPVLALSGVELVSLQKDVRERDLAALAGAKNLIDLRSELNDFRDTAAVISTLDLVIAIDTAVAHLAGALGKRTFLMLPFAPDWRWLLERADCPWYPTMRLFRQTKPGQWGDVVAPVAEAAAAFAGAGAPRLAGG